jgi:outer membrane immunogenic protein
MRRWSVVLTAAVSVIASTQMASAADLLLPIKAPPPPPVFSWTGFYLGANLGDGWSASHGPVTLSNNFGAVVPGFVNTDPKGAFGGIQAGYNYQWNWLVLGIEADIEAADIDSDRTSTVGVNQLVATRKVEDFGSIRGRAGVAFNQFLVYGTGGWGFANFKRSMVVNGVAQLTGNAEENGYVVGGGVEYAFMPRWSVKAEYQYFRFNDYNPAGPVVPPNGVTVFANPQNDSFHTVRVGLNYKF